jgi:glycosyltransferase involved in cell wall biosynthesis
LPAWAMIASLRYCVGSEFGPVYPIPGPHPSLSVLKLGQAIIRLIDSPELYTKFIENGIKTAKKFTWENTPQQMEKVLLDISRSSD